MYKTISNFLSGLIFIAIIVSILPNTTLAALPSGFEMQSVVSGLTLPTGMAFTEDGRIFVAEKGGAVRVIKNGLLLSTPLIALSDINTYGDRGLIGIAVDPLFSQNGYLYLSYTYENTPGINVAGVKTGRIVRVTVVGDIADESSKIILVGSVGGNINTPSCENYATTSDCIPSDAQSHSVGGLRFGPDGKLYATLGDGASFDYADYRSLRAQNIDSLAGKMLRINKDGTAPSDNPFYNGNPNANRSKVYAYGFRNTYRFSFRPTNNSIYGGDVGWSSWEEVNKIVPGGNYGWPCREGNGSTVGYTCTAPNYINPIYTYPHNSNGSGSIAMGSFPTGSAYPAQFSNTLFFGDYAQNWIKTINVDSSDNFISVSDFALGADGTNGPVELLTGPDGNIYFIAIYTGQVKKITHTLGNRSPITVISASPTNGLAPLNVSFSSAGSSDPDGDPITFLWNFGDNSTSTLANPIHVYTANGTYNASLTVKDNKGSQQTKSVTISVGNRAPTANITSPLTGSLYTPGTSITLTGNGTDPEDGNIPAGNMSWRMILHHNTHTHVLQTSAGNNIAFTPPDHSDPDVYTEIELTVTDSGGLTNKKSVNIYLDNNTSQSSNLIQNPSFEEVDPLNSGSANYWSTNWWGSLNPIFTYPVVGYEGPSSKAGRVEITQYTSGDAKWVFSPVSATENTQYTFSDYYTSNTDSTLVLQIGNQNGSLSYLNLGSLPPATNWTNVTRTFTTPINTKTISVFHLIDRVGTLTVDNYSLAVGTTTPDNTPPIVSIISPVASSTISGTISISASATDNVGVAGVKFLIDGSLFGTEDISSPFSLNWNTASSTNGVHNVVAVARDAKGNIATSTLISFTVSNGASGPDLISNGNLEVANGTLPNSWTKGGWGTNTRVLTYPTVGLDGGKAARVEITAYPANGTGDAKWVHNKVPVTPGTEYTYTDRYRSNIISDIIGEYTLSDGSLHYFGLAKEIQPNTTWQTISGTFIPPVNATHVTFYHLISSIGYVEIDDIDMHVTGSGTPSETIPPVVEFTNPVNGQTVSGIVPITASSSDNVAVTYVFYAVDGTPITGQLTNSPYLFDWNSSSVPNGPHLLKATTHDPSGNNSTATITVTVNNSAGTSTLTNLIQNPSLETLGANNLPSKWQNGKYGTNTTVFTYPTSGFDGNGATVAMTAYTSGDAKWFFDDVSVTPGEKYIFSEYYKSNVSTNVTLRFTNTAGGYQYLSLGTVPAQTNWTKRENTITIPTGVNSMTVFHLIDKIGSLSVDSYSLVKEGASTSVDTILPSVSITTPLNNATTSGQMNVSVNASDNVAIGNVRILLDDVLVGTPITSAPYNFIVNTASYTNGLHVLKAIATDTSSNVSSTTINLNFDNASVDTTPPIVSITSPTNSSTVSGTTTIQVSATDNTGVSSVHILIDNIDVISDATAPYEVAIDTRLYQNGTHVITSYAEDVFGNIGNATPVNINVDNVPVIPPSNNLIPNGNLETVDPVDPTKPQSWFKGGWGTNTATLTYPSVGNEGARGAKVDMTSYTDGDAKWFFGDISVTAGESYVFREQYKANVPTVLTARFTYPDNSVQYRDIVNLSSSANWITVENNILIPVGATSMTLFHIINTVGSLEIDDYYLTGSATPIANTFPEGLVSLTFDDGWVDQYENALPILENANLKAGFYIVTKETLEAVPNNRISNGNLETVDPVDPDEPDRWSKEITGTNNVAFSYPSVGRTGNGVKIDITSYTSGEAKWFFDEATLISDQNYEYTDYYTSTVPTSVYIEYTLNDSSVSTELLGIAPSSASWIPFTKNFLVPNNLKSARIYHVLNSVGSINIDDADLNRVPIYLNPTQVADIKNLGHEIGSHTQTHPYLTTLTTEEALDEIVNSKTDLTNTMNITPVDTFIYPYGDYNNTVKQMVTNAGYIGARSVDRGFNYRDTDKYSLKIQQVDRTTTLSQFQSWVDEARNNKTWLILMFHQVSNDPEATLGVSPTLLQQMVNFLVTEQVNVVKMQDGILQMS